MIKTKYLLDEINDNVADLREGALAQIAKATELETLAAELKEHANRTLAVCNELCDRRPTVMPKAKPLEEVEKEIEQEIAGTIAEGGNPVPVPINFSKIKGGRNG